MWQELMPDLVRTDEMLDDGNLRYRGGFVVAFIYEDNIHRKIRKNRERGEPAGSVAGILAGQAREARRAGIPATPDG